MCQTGPLPAKTAEAALLVLTNLPAELEQRHVQELRALLLDAWQPLLSQRAVKDDQPSAAAPCVKTLSQEEVRLLGPSVLATFKSVTPRLVGGMQPAVAKELTALLSSALRALDCIRPSMTPKPLQLETQHYNVARRMLLAGQARAAFNEGCLLHDALERLPSTSPAQDLGKQLSDMQLACRVHVIYSCAELLTDSSACGTVDSCLAATLPIITQLLEQIRAVPDAAKHAEGLSRTLPKLVMAACASTVSVDLLGGLLSAWMCAAQLAGPSRRLAQCLESTVRGLMSSAAAAKFMGGLLQVLAAPQQTLQEGVGIKECVHAVLKAASDKHGDAGTLLSLPGWDRCVEQHPHLGLLHALWCIRTTNSSGTQPGLAMDAASLWDHGLHKVQEAVAASGDPEQWPVLWSVAHDVHNAILDSLSAGDMPPVCQLEPQLACASVSILTAQASWSLRLIQGDTSLLRISKEEAVQVGVMALALACRLLSLTLRAAPATHTTSCTAAAALDEALGSALPALLQHDSCRAGLSDQAWMADMMAAAGSDLLGQGQHTSLPLSIMSASTQVALQGLTDQVQQGGLAHKGLGQALKLCRLHVTALSRQGLLQEAVSVGTAHVVHLAQVVQHDARQLSSLMKAVVTARMQLALLNYGRDVQAAERSGGEASTSAPSAPSRAGSRRGRAGAPKVATAARDTKQPPVSPQQHTTPVPQQRSITEALCASGPGCMPGAAYIDMYAYTEAALVREFLTAEAAASSDAVPDNKGFTQVESMAVAAITGSAQGALQATQGPADAARAVLLGHILSQQRFDGAALQEAAEVLRSATNAHSTASSVTPECILNASAAALCSSTAVIAAASHSMQVAVRDVNRDTSSPSKPVAAGSERGGVTETDAQVQQGLDAACAMWSKLTSWLSGNSGTAGSGAITGLAGSAILCPQLCLEALTKLWMLLHLRDDPSGLMKVEPALKAILIACSIRPAGALCSIWALCHVRTECASRALAPAPGATLAEELDCSERCGPEVHSLLQELQQARSLPITSQYDNLHVAACAASKVVPSQRGAVWLLLRAQLHQAAAGAQLQLGGTTAAFIHSQEALQLAEAVYHSCSPPAAMAPQTGAGDEAQGASSSASQQHDSAVTNSISGDQGFCLWAAAAAVYMSSLLQAALVFDAGGCVEDAAALVRECIRLAGSMGASGVLAAAGLLRAGMALRQQRKDKVAERLNSADAIVMSGVLKSSSLDSLLKAEVLLTMAGTDLELHYQPAEAAGKLTQVVDMLSSGPPTAAPWAAARQQCLLAQAYLQLAQCCMHQSQLPEADNHLAAAATITKSMSADQPPLQAAYLLARHNHVLASGVMRTQAPQILIPGTPQQQASLPSPSSQISPATESEQPSAAAASRGKGSRKGRATKAVPAGGAEVPLGAKGNSASLPVLEAQLLDLLRALQLGWELPLLVQQVATALLQLLLTAGAPQAAAMFLHLSLGAGTRQLQVMLQAAKQAPWAGGGHAEDIRAEAAGVNHNTAAALLSTSALGVIQHVLDRSKSAQQGEVLDMLEQGAGNWLQDSLAVLPASMTVVTLSGLQACSNSSAANTAPTQPLLLTRLRRGAPPVLMWLPPGEAGPGAPGASSRDACGAPKQDQLLAALCHPLVQQLAQLLDDSTASMQMSGVVETPEVKMQWLKARQQLDARMSDLLTCMERTWLGPWRCLLRPAPSTPPDCFTAVAQQITTQMLQGVPSSDTTTNSSRRAIVMELVTALMVSCQQAGEDKGPVVAALQHVHHALHGCTGQDAAIAALATTLLAASVPTAVATPAASQQSFTGAEAVYVLEQKAMSGTQVSTCSNAGVLDSGGSPEPEGAEVPRRVAAATLTAGRRAGRAAAAALPAIKASAAGRRAVPSAVVADGSTQPSTSESQAAAAAAAPGRKRPGSRLAALAQPPPADQLPPVLPQQPQGKEQAAPSNIVKPAPAGRAAGRGRRAPPVQTSIAVAQEPEAQPATAGSRSGGDIDGCSSTAHEAEQQHIATAANQVPAKDGQLLLILQSDLHALPWESIPYLRGPSGAEVEVYRMPSLPSAAFAACLASRFGGSSAPSAASQAGGASVAQEQEAPSRKGPVASKASARGRRGAAQEPEPKTTAAAGGGSKEEEKSSNSSSSSCAGTSQGACLPRVDLSSTFYLLNPDGDLKETQETFRDWFVKELKWQGTAGSPLTSTQLLSALQSHSLFVYMGHGSGEQYLSLAKMRRLQGCATDLLMGCSSGRLRQHGRYGPAGAVLSYLVAGCPAVIANLWDVTDKDIDRFSLKLLQSWLQQEGSAQGAKGVTLCRTLASCRAACRLPHLIGAAPVCYGLPAVVYPLGQ